MFVKWKRRRGGCHVWWDTISAYVVESAWNKGKPRHRHICYIASFADVGVPDGPNNYMERCAIEMIGTRHLRAHAFWKTAMENLARAGIEGDNLAKIVASLEEVVPKPTMDERSHPSYDAGPGLRRMRQIEREIKKETIPGGAGGYVREFVRRYSAESLPKGGDDDCG
jgi:hypothetical protein